MEVVDTGVTFGKTASRKMPKRSYPKKPRFGRERHMLRYALIFLIIALIAGFLGFGGVAFAAAGIAKILFVVFLVLFVVGLIMHLGRGGRAI
jgi:uncharacterized membrane protein YtjA (UPF0391 family)